MGDFSERLGYLYEKPVFGQNLIISLGYPPGTVKTENLMGLNTTKKSIFDLADQNDPPQGGGGGPWGSQLTKCQ